jgi:hypothetical protein
MPKQKVKQKMKKNDIKSQPKGGTATSNAKKPSKQLGKTGGAVTSPTREEGSSRRAKGAKRINASTLAKNTKRKMKDTTREGNKAVAKKRATRAATKATVKGAVKKAGVAGAVIGAAMDVADRQKAKRSAASDKKIAAKTTKASKKDNEGFPKRKKKK